MMFRLNLPDSEAASSGEDVYGAVPTPRKESARVGELRPVDGAFVNGTAWLG